MVGTIIVVSFFGFFYLYQSAVIAQTASGDIKCTLTPTSAGLKGPVSLPIGGPVASDALVNGQTFTISCYNKYDKDPALTGAAQTTAGLITRPDLTAAPPEITCEAWARLGTDTNGVQKCHKGSKLSIAGSINNVGTAATQNGAFASLYQYSTDERIWNDFSETTLKVDSAPLGAQGTVSATNRPLKPYSGTATEPWVAGYAPASDHYWHFRVCADNQKSVPESDEGNNCSASTRLKVLGLKPDVTLWISRTGEDCKTLKQTQAVILKGNKALLCWLVTPIEIFE